MTDTDLSRVKFSIPFEHPLHGKIQMPQFCHVCGKPATQFQTKTIEVKHKISSQLSTMNMGGTRTTIHYAVKTSTIKLPWCDEHWKTRKIFDRNFFIALFTAILFFAISFVPLIWGVQLYERYGILPLLLVMGASLMIAVVAMVFTVIFASDDHPLWFRKLTRINGGLFMWQSDENNGNLILTMAQHYGLLFSELNRIKPAGQAR